MPTVNYLWDPIEDNVIAEFDDDGGLIVEYTTEPDHHGDVISQRRDGETNCFYSDGLGSTTEVTNAAGDTIATRAYSAFGGTTETTGSVTFPFQYLGQKGYYFDSDTGNFYIGGENGATQLRRIIGRVRRVGKVVAELSARMVGENGARLVKYKGA